MLNQELATLAPIVDNAVLYQTFMTQSETFGTIEERFNEIPQEQQQASRASGYTAGDSRSKLGSWAKLFGQYANQKMQDNIAGYRANLWGVAGGIDKTFCENNLIGLAFSWSNLDLHHHVAPDSETSANSYQSALYGSFHFTEAPIYFNWLTAVAYNDYTNQHNIVMGTLNLTPQGSFHGWQYGAKAEMGYVFTEKNNFYSPFASLYYSYLTLHDYTETGANTANQAIAGSQYDMLQGGIGIKFAQDYAKNNYRFRPEIYMIALYDFVGDEMQTTSQFTGAGPSFSTIGFKPAQDSYRFGGNLSIFNLSSGISVLASYDFNYKRHYTAHSGFLKLRYAW